MESQALYPARIDQESIRMLIARNLASVEVYQSDTTRVQPQIDSSRHVLNQLARNSRLSYHEFRLLKRTLLLLGAVGVPVTTNHSVLNET